MQQPLNEFPDAASRKKNETLADSRAGKMQVEIRELSREESLAIVSKHHMGRWGMAFHDLVSVELTAYLYSDGWIYARTEVGRDLGSARIQPWAAFEVGEVDGIYDWRTVEIRGQIEVLKSDFGSPDWFVFENAVHLMRSVVPQVRTAEDPLPERVEFVRIHVDKVRGREARGKNTSALPLP